MILFANAQKGKKALLSISELRSNFVTVQISRLAYTICEHELAGSCCTNVSFKLLLGYTY
jgi:hypothetical protein